MLPILKTRRLVLVAVLHLTQEMARPFGAYAKIHPINRIVIILFTCTRHAYLRIQLLVPASRHKPPRVKLILPLYSDRPPVPIHLFTAGEESIVDNDKTIEYIKSLGWEHTRMTRYEDSRHSVEFDVPELFYSDLVSFIDEANDVAR